MQNLSKYKLSTNVSGRNRFLNVLWYFINALVFNSDLLPVNFLKVSLLRLFGAKVGRGVVIKPLVRIKYPWKLEIGDYSWIGESVWIDNLDEVKIGKNCCISQGVLLLSGNHNYKVETFDLMLAPIEIKDSAWVGAKSIVTQGVTIGKGAVISVGSIVSKDVLEMTINKGNPIAFVKNR